MSFPFLPALRPARCGDPGAEIPFACLFDGAEYLTMAPAAQSDRTKWAWSAWVRRTKLGSNQTLFGTSVQADGYDRLDLRFDASDHLNFSFAPFGADNNCASVTTAVYRDTAAAYHVYVVFDSANATPGDRMQIWINGVRQSVTVAGNIATVPLAADGRIGNGNPIRIGALQYLGGYYLSAYLSDVNFVWGEAPPVTAFGYLNRFGIWVPRRYVGTYGAIGCHLDFADPLTLGADASGNGNHYTSVGLTAANQVTDTPTNTYCTLASNVFGGFVLSDGGLRAYRTGAGSARAAGTMVFDAATDAVSWQVTTTTTSAQQWYVGVAGERTIASGVTYTNEVVISYGGSVVVDGVWVSPHPVAAIPNGARLEIAIIRGAMYLWVDGAPSPADGSPVVSGLTGRRRPLVGFGSSGNNNVTHTLDFGQRGYQPRPGTRLLCTRDMACPAIKRPERYVTSRLRSGGASVADLPWSPVDIPTAVLSRRRDAAAPWRLNLSTRPGRAIATNDAAGDFAEADGLTFTRSGYAIGAAAAYQGSRVDYVWRVSAAAGFDLLTVDHVTGAPTTVAHKLGRIVDYAWALNLSTGAIKRMYHRRGLAAGQYLAINANVAAVTEAGWFASDALSLTLGSGLPSGTYAVLAWAEVPQFSSFGRHIGNAAADGAFAAMDFAPALAITKNTAVTSANYPTVQDTARSPHNPVDNRLWLSDAANAETSDGNGLCDFVSNGLKVRTTHFGLNGSGQTIIHAAWAGTPQKFGRAR